MSTPIMHKLKCNLTSDELVLQQIVDTNNSKIVIASRQQKEQAST